MTASKANSFRTTAGTWSAARDEVGLRALNDALRAAFDAPGAAGFGRGGAVRLEAQILRHRFHERLMRAFLDPEVFEGAVVIRHQAGEGPRSRC